MEATTGRGGWLKRPTARNYLVHGWLACCLSTGLPLAEVEVLLLLTAVAHMPRTLLVDGAAQVGACRWGSLDVVGAQQGPVHSREERKPLSPRDSYG